MILLAGVVIGLALFMVLRPGTGDSPSGSDGGPSGDTVAAKDALLAGPYDIQIDLVIDIPKGSESDNPDHQEFSGEGTVDLDAGLADLTYNFNGLNNAAGFLGHFEEMHVLAAEDVIYLEVFTSGPPWLRLGATDIGKGDVSRLRDILLTFPLALPAYLEVDGQESTSSTDLSRSIASQALASSVRPLSAAVGGYLQEQDVDSMDVEVAHGEGTVREVVLTFSYHPQGAQGRIELQVTYRFSTADDFEVDPPLDDDVREYSEIFG